MRLAYQFSILNKNYSGRKTENASFISQISLTERWSIMNITGIISLMFLLYIPKNRPLPLFYCYCLAMCTTSNIGELNDINSNDAIVHQVNRQSSNIQHLRHVVARAEPCES